VAYGKVEVFEEGSCEVDLFVQDSEGARVGDRELLQELRERVRVAVALPVHINIRDVFDASCTELTVTAFIGAPSSYLPGVVAPGAAAGGTLAGGTFACLCSATLTHAGRGGESEQQGPGGGMAVLPRQ
jgi:hypothetical protein